MKNKTHSIAKNKGVASFDLSKTYSRLDEIEKELKIIRKAVWCIRFGKPILREVSK